LTNDGVATWNENTGYQIDFEDLPESDLNKVTRENLRELFDYALTVKPLQLGLTRYLLRRAKKLKTGMLQKGALHNLSKLAPAMREVIDYLSATAKPKNADAIGKAILEHMASSPVGRLPFVRLWGLEYFVRRPLPVLLRRVMKLAEDSRDSLGIRPAALLARANKQIQWIRAHKEDWSNHAPWDRRSIIWAASMLPSDERRHWCGLVRDTASDPLDRAVATLAGNG
jgi:hypothetical protein